MPDNNADSAETSKKDKKAGMNSWVLIAVLGLPLILLVLSVIYYTPSIVVWMSESKFANAAAQISDKPSEGSATDGVNTTPNSEADETGEKETLEADELFAGKPNPPKSLGEFGDMYGATNALFSGLAFVFVILALMLQTKELGLQREELEETRGEFEKQRGEMETQNRSFRQQIFDNTFFQMLTLHHEIVNGIDTGEMGGVPRTGRDCFVRFYRELRTKLDQAADGSMPNTIATKPNLPRRADIDVCELAYAEHFRAVHADLGHYYRNLFNIIKFVDRSDVENKEFYTGLIVAQLSTAELLMIFYNCTCGHGRGKFAEFAVKYSLFEHLPRHELLHADHADWLDEKAYAG